MTEKANSPLEEMNKTLTNLLDYREVLANLSASVEHEATKKKLQEFAEVKKNESQSLMKVIKEMGGHIDGNERMTDQEAVYWVPRPLPEAADLKVALAKLIDTEQNAIKEYKHLMAQDEIETQHHDTFEKFQQEAEANLKYFQSAKQSMEN